MVLLSGFEARLRVVMMKIRNYSSRYSPFFIARGYWWDMACVIAVDLVGRSPSMILIVI